MVTSFWNEEKPYQVGRVDHGKENNVMKHNFAGPPIMKDEIRVPIKKMKLGKATSPDINFFFYFWLF